MTERRNVAAHTAPGTTYPEYISINQRPDGTVEVTVRGPAEAHESKRFQVPGHEATATMSAMQFQALWLQAAKNFRA